MVIMILVIIICIIGRQYQVKSIDDAIVSLDNMMSLSHTDMIASSEHLNDSFNRCARVFQFYMNHADIESVKNAIVSLCSAIRYHNEADIMIAVDFARAQLRKLRDIDAAVIENVL